MIRSKRIALIIRRGPRRGFSTLLLFGGAWLAGFAPPPSAAQELQLAAEHLPPAAEAVPSPAGAPPLSLEDLERIALANNPSLARAAALVGASRGDWTQVGLLPNPEVGYDGQQLGSDGLAEQQGIFFTQEFVTAGKLRLNRSTANFEVERRRQELAAQRQRVLTDVRVAYYQVLLAQRQIDLTNNLVHVSTEGARAVHQLLKALEATRADVLQAELEVENARVLFQNAHNRHAAAWQRMGAVIGDSSVRPQPLGGDAFAAPRRIEFQPALDAIRSASPEIAAAFADVDRARAALERARVEPIPNVSVSGLVNVIDNGIGGRPDGGLVASVPIPVFNRNQGRIYEAQNELAAKERAVQQLELSLQERLATVYERYANARNQVDRYQAVILAAASESLELMRKTYEAGEADYVSLLVAQRTYFQTHLNYLDALLNLRVAEAEIDGLLLMNSLDNR